MTLDEKNYFMACKNDNVKMIKKYHLFNFDLDFMNDCIIMCLEKQSFSCLELIFSDKKYQNNFHNVYHINSYIKYNDDECEYILNLYFEKFKNCISESNFLLFYTACEYKLKNAIDILFKYCIKSNYELNAIKIMKECNINYKKYIN